MTTWTDLAAATHLDPTVRWKLLEKTEPPTMAQAHAVTLTSGGD